MAGPEYRLLQKHDTQRRRFQYRMRLYFVDERDGENPSSRIINLRYELACSSPQGTIMLMYPLSSRSNNLTSDTLMVNILFYLRPPLASPFSHYLIRDVPYQNMNVFEPPDTLQRRPSLKPQHSRLSTRNPPSSTSPQPSSPQPLLPKLSIRPRCPLQSTISPSTTQPKA